jgi:hypothetical protein
MNATTFPTYKPHVYTKEISLEYGQYLVVRKDGKVHLETYNGTGFAYNNDTIVVYYLPKIK